MNQPTSHEQDLENKGLTTLSLTPRCQGHLRETIRQQILGDRELMRDIMAGREDPGIRYDVGQRIECLRAIGGALGLPENPERRRQSRDTSIPPRPPLWKRRLIELIWKM